MAGFLDQLFGSSKGTNAGNTFEPLQGNSTQAVNSYLTRGPQDASNEVMADPRLSQYFGQGWNNINNTVGALSGEERDQATNGFKLNEQDNTALGQASGNIARQFGQRDTALSQALAARGLSRSGGAANAIANSQGTKGEQLAQIQQNIAQQRIQNNMQRLNSTRQFMSQMLGQQAQREGQYEGAMNDKNAFAQSKAQMGQGNLAMQNAQANQQFEQNQQTSNSGLMGAVRRGLLSGAETMSGAGLSQAMSAMGGGGGPTGGSAASGVGGAAGGGGVSAGGAGGIAKMAMV